MSSWPALRRQHNLLTDINGFVFAFLAGGGSSRGEWKRSGCVLSLEEDALVFLELFPGFGGILEQVEVMSCFDEFPRPILSRPSKTTAEEMGELVKSRASLRARVALRRCVSRARVPGQSRSQARRNSRVCLLLLPPTMIVPTRRTRHHLCADMFSSSQLRLGSSSARSSRGVTRWRLLPTGLSNTVALGLGLRVL